MHLIGTIGSMIDFVIIAHNLRSSHNVGSLLRTAEGAGVRQVYLTGHTPYPLTPDDVRLPHIARKVTNQIQKTALGAEISQKWSYQEDVRTVIEQLRAQGYSIIALEQSKNASPLPFFVPPEKSALILGREVEGIEEWLLGECDKIVEIPMHGKKESFNVVQAAAMAVYHFCYVSGDVH